MNDPLRLASLSLAASFVLLAGGCGGCGGGDGSTPFTPPPPTAPAPAPASVERPIAPSTINSQVTTANEPHILINPSPAVTAQGRLFVFLPGTGGHPVMYDYIQQAAAARGYHVIGLNYPNPTAVGVLCKPFGRTDPDCYYKVRNEIITGENTSALVSVSGADAIQQRLHDAIDYMQATYPAEGWGQFLLAGGAVDWSRVVVGGHSQGGGHAGMMAKKVALARACYFSSPPDWIDETSRPAPWVSLANVTPAARQFGFTHVQDDLVPYAQVTTVWRTLGMGTAVVSVDTQAPPYGAAQQLSTNATPASNGLSASPTHGAPVLDAVTPIAASGRPLFDPVWGYACFQ